MKSKLKGGYRVGRRLIPATLLSGNKSEHLINSLMDGRSLGSSSESTDPPIDPSIVDPSDGPQGQRLQSLRLSHRLHFHFYSSLIFVYSLEQILIADTYTCTGGNVQRLTSSEKNVHFVR